MFYISPQEVVVVYSVQCAPSIDAGIDWLAGWVAFEFDQNVTVSFIPRVEVVNWMVPEVGISFRS